VSVDKTAIVLPLFSCTFEEASILYDRQEEKLARRYITAIIIKQTNKQKVKHERQSKAPFTQAICQKLTTT
jgi:hypothetical protein